MIGKKKKPLVVQVLRDYNAERRMTDFANHSSFCFEVLEHHPLYRLNVLEGCIELVAQHCQVIVEFLARYLGVDLCRDDVRVSQDTAHTLDRHSF